MSPNANSSRRQGCFPLAMQAKISGFCTSFSLFFTLSYMIFAGISTQMIQRNDTDCQRSAHVDDGKCRRRSRCLELRWHIGIAVWRSPRGLGIRKKCVIFDSFFPFSDSSKRRECCAELLESHRYHPTIIVQEERHVMMDSERLWVRWEFVAGNSFGQRYVIHFSA